MFVFPIEKALEHYCMCNIGVSAICIFGLQIDKYTDLLHLPRLY